MEEEPLLDLEISPPEHTPKESALKAIQAICNNPGTVLIIGARETGKSTFAHTLLKEALSANPELPCTLIDADMAHCSLAPPSVIGAARVQLAKQEAAQSTALFQFGTRTQHFIGDCQPAGGYAPEIIAAIGRLHGVAQECGSRLTAIDMPALPDIKSFFRMVWNCIDMLRPAHVVAFSRGEDWVGLAAQLKRRQDIQVHLLAPASASPPRPIEFRSKRLSVRFGAALENSENHTFEMAKCTLTNTWLGSGSRLAPHLFKYLSGAVSDYYRVYYAELTGARLGIMVNRRSAEAEQALAIAIEQLAATSVTISVAQELKHRLVGLHTDRGKFVGLGRIESIDFARETITISTPVRAITAVTEIRFGGRCIAESGETTLRVPPGEL